MKKITVLLMIAIFGISTTSFAQRGHIVLATTVESWSPEEIMAELDTQFDDPTYALINLITYKNYSVSAVKVVYETIDGQGDPAEASGMIFLPQPAEMSYLPMMSYLHGTLTSFSDLPSNLGGAESVVGWIMAMDGYISVLPDYLGMGDYSDPSIHPYHHADTEASASVDLLKAALQYCSSPEVYAKPSGDLYLSGYSQGAHAALATQRELQSDPLPGLTLKKTVAGSGAYSLSYIQKKFMFDNPEYPNTSFIPYLLLGYEQVYGNLYNSLDEVFVPPYNTDAPGYFDGYMTVEEIDDELPLNWTDMFVTKYLNKFKYRYFHPANAAMRANDLISWKPESDLHLYYCNCDELVARENSMLAYWSFIMRGSRSVTCLPLGSFNHRDCAPFVLLLAKIQFDLASGTGPAGFNPQTAISQYKSGSGKDLSQFYKALDTDATQDLSEVYSNKMISEYLAGQSGLSESLTIYPNPADYEALVQIPDDLPDNSRMHVYDMQGRLLISENITGTNMKIDVRALPPGLYRIAIEGQGNYNGKLIVAR